MIDGKTIDWRWPNFSPWELRSDRGHATLEDFQVWIDPTFLDTIQDLRRSFDRPLVVSSYYRSPEYDESIGGAGPHRTGQAIDFSIAGEDAYLLVQKAMKMGFTGIGVNQKGPWEKRFIHVDILGEKRPRIWNY